MHSNNKVSHFNKLLIGNKLVLFYLGSTKSLAFQG